MSSKKETSHILYLFIVVLLLSVINTSCGKIDYTVQVFTFPGGSRIHQNNWTHMLEIVVKSKHTPITDRSSKDITIKVIDRLNNILLEKHYNLFCASVKASVRWDKLDSLELKLIEVGNEFAKDQYNKKLLINGPNELVQMSLIYDRRNNIYY